MLPVFRPDATGNLTMFLQIRDNLPPDIHALSPEEQQARVSGGQAAKMPCLRRLHNIHHEPRAGVE